MLKEVRIRNPRNCSRLQLAAANTPGIAIREFGKRAQRMLDDLSHLQDCVMQGVIKVKFPSTQADEERCYVFTSTPQDNAKKAVAGGTDSW